MALYAFDGTWNRDQEVDERDTNVRKVFELSDEPDDKKLYSVGIGTRFGWLGRIFGGANPIRDAFRKCRPDDRVHYSVGPIDGRPDRDDCNPFVFTAIESEVDEGRLVV